MEPDEIEGMMKLDDLPQTLCWHEAAGVWTPAAVEGDGAGEPAPEQAGAAHLSLIDQRKLPHALEYLDCYSSDQVCDAIAELAVRGAPVIGISGAYAMVLWAKNEWPLTAAGKAKAARPAAGKGAAAGDVAASGGAGSDEGSLFVEAFRHRAAEVAATRPTAVNLSWAVEQIRTCLEDALAAGSSLEDAVLGIERRAGELALDDEQCSKRIGEHGAAIFAELAAKLGRPLNVQTHCNAGSLATMRLGTATAVIYEACAQGNVANVWVDETRPVDQGARLTAWELGRAGVPYTLVCDDMAGALMKQGKVDAIVVGADRICANGDVANKIGTYQLAVLAHHHGVPFYVAAPRSTFDESLATGDEIEIEERDGREVRCMPSGREWLPVAPQGCKVYNPAFDVTPHELITGIITD